MTHPVHIHYPIQNDLPFRRIVRKVVKTNLGNRIGSDFQEGVDIVIPICHTHQALSRHTVTAILAHVPLVILHLAR